MRFLVLAEPAAPAPFDLIPSLIAAEQQWRERYADRLEAYAWFATGGGTGIIDVDDAETLFQAIAEHPFCPYTKTEVRPLADADDAGRRFEAAYANALAGASA
jgi:muconolactone delta-isomerase